MPDNDPIENLIRSAREWRPDTSRVEYGFETRLMARVQEAAGGEPRDMVRFIYRVMLGQIGLCCAIVVGLFIFTAVNGGADMFHGSATLDLWGDWLELEILRGV